MAEGDTGTGSATGQTGQADPATGQSDDKGKGGTPSPNDMPGAKGQADPPEGKTGDDPKTLEEMRQALENQKSLNRRLRSDGTELAKKAKKFDELEESQKTEIQKANDRAAAAEREAAETRSEKFRYQAASAAKLPSDSVEFLGSGTEEEITERAGRFSTLLDTAVNERLEALGFKKDNDGKLQFTGQANGGQQRRPGTGRPAESLRPGAAPASSTAPGNANDWFRDMISGSAE